MTYIYSARKALGIDLIVHNIAQGANNCIPYTMCYESMGGKDPDFVGWEQSYNCGHADDVFEVYFIQEIAYKNIV